MPTLTVNGRAVTVDDSFTKLSPAEQNATVDEIAKSLPAEQPSGVVDGLRQGAASLLSGPASTAKRMLGVEAPSLEAAAESIAPKNYKSAPVLGPDSKWYDPTSYNWKNVPQMVAENAPQMAESIAAAKLGAKVHPLVGLAAGAVPFAVNALGDTAKNNAVNRTGDTASEPDKADKLRAAGTVAAQSIPQMIGIARLANPGAIRAVGGKGAAQSVGQGATTVGIEGATGAAQEAIGQVGNTIGTPGGVKINTDQMAEQGVGNAILGGGFAAPKMAYNAAAANKYRKFGGANEAATEVFANKIKDAADGANLGNTENGFNAVRQAHEDTISQLKTAADAAGPGSPETTAAIARATKGRVLTDADLNELSTNSTPDVARLAREAHVGAMLKDMGDYQGGKFAGGLAHGIGKHVRAYSAPISAGASAALGAATGGGHAASLFAYSPETLSALAGAYAAMRGVDALTGNRSPAEKFTNRFSTDAPIPGATPPMQPPAPPQPIPTTTSVPQVTPPSAPAQPWGAPQPAPTPLDANALNVQVKAAFEKYAARRKYDGQRDAEAEAANSALINDQGGLDALRNPALGKRAKELLGNADALKRLRSDPEADASEAASAKAEAAAVKGQAQSDASAAKYAAKVETLKARADAAMVKAQAKAEATTAKAQAKAEVEAAKAAAKVDAENTIPSFLPNDIPSFLPKRDAAIPAAPTPEAIPQFPPNRNEAAPSISSLMDNMRARYPVAAQAAAPDAAPVQITKKSGKKVKEKAAAPAPVYEDNPYPQQVSDTHSNRDIKTVNRGRPVDASGEAVEFNPRTGEAFSNGSDYTPLKDSELYGRDFTHEQFGKHAASQINDGRSVLDPEKYSKAVQQDHKTYEHVLQRLSQYAEGPQDTPTLQRLLQELYHVRRSDDALRAVRHYSKKLTPDLRRRVMDRLDATFVTNHWSKQ